MKLRNKKTGEIRNVNFVLITDAQKKDGAFVFRSIEQLIGEYEDYNPKEPRINDDDARDALYSWASSLQIHKVRSWKRVSSLGIVVITFEAFGLDSAPRIEFPDYIDADVADGGIYTIPELCGTPPEPIEPTFVDLDERIKEKEE